MRAEEQTDGDVALLRALADFQQAVEGGHIYFVFSN